MARSTATKPDTSKTKTSTEVRSPTSTSTSTEAATAGNVTITGGAGAGDTSVTLSLVPQSKAIPLADMFKTKKAMYGSATAPGKGLTSTVAKPKRRNFYGGK